MCARTVHARAHAHALEHARVRVRVSEAHHGCPRHARLLRRLQPEYEAALARLQAVLELEGVGKLPPLAPIPDHIWRLRGGGDDEEEGDEEAAEEREDEAPDGGASPAEPSEAVVEPRKRRADDAPAQGGSTRGAPGSRKAQRAEPNRAAADAVRGREKKAAHREEVEWRRVLAAQLKARVQARRRARREPDE